jgi:hypothetical protein
MPKITPNEYGQLRRLTETDLKPGRIKLLAKNSCEQAAKMVPDPALRAKICQEARRMGVGPARSLGKKDLAAIDAKFLADGRRPDPKFVRWVLRCEGLHPQGRV